MLNVTSTIVALAALALAMPASARAETLHFTVNWQSGLSLGEASITSLRAGEASSDEGSGSAANGHWSFNMELDASIPGFPIRDEYRAKAGPELCSAELTKTLVHGEHKGSEKVTFDQDAKRVKRETDGGGESEYPVSACARDALTYLQFVRQELAQGRLAPQQDVVLGASYEVRLTYTGTQRMRVGDEVQEADIVRASVKGPMADIDVDLYFARDAERTPLAAKIPSNLGTFSVELIP